MKKLTVLLLALTLNATAVHAISQPKIEARCYAWADISGIDKAAEVHMKLALKSLSEAQVMYQVGFAAGFLHAFDKEGAAESNKRAAYLLYTTNCTSSI